jgi:hypothetical protein
MVEKDRKNITKRIYNCLCYPYKCLLLWKFVLAKSYTWVQKHTINPKRCVLDGWEIEKNREGENEYRILRKFRPK